jgi:molecular chaperone DnaK (HSP70)
VSADVGLDFGTATTVVAERTPAGPAAVVPLGRATTWLPSVARLDGPVVVVGEAADDGAGAPIRSVKRAITERRSTVSVGDGVVDADRVMAAILAEAARRAEAAGVPLGDGRGVRLGCPVLWDGPQRRRLLDVAATAGLAVDEARLLDEPVAAGLAWLRHRYLGAGDRPAGRLLVFDMGGGTLDVAVMRVEAGPRPRVAVLAAAGAAVAGDALDAAVARDVAIRWPDLASLGLAELGRAELGRAELVWALLERSARETKTRLSYVDEDRVVVPLPGAPAPRYDRARLEAVFAGQMDGAETLALTALRAARAAESAVTAARLRAVDRRSLAEDVDFVLLVGGMTRIPYVRRRLSALFARARVDHDAGVAADEVVAAGLADAAHARVTLPRPGVDLVLEYAGGRQRLYEAHTPLFEPWQIYSGYSDLTYERWLRPPEVPSRGEGRLRAFGLYGGEVDLAVDGRVGPLSVRFGPDGVALRLSGHGAVEVVDAGGVTALRVDGWPAADPDGEPLALSRVPASSAR